MSACLNCSCPRADHIRDGLCGNDGCRCDGYEGSDDTPIPAPVTVVTAASVEVPKELPRVIPVRREPTLADLLAEQLNVPPEEVTAAVDARSAAALVPREPESVRAMPGRFGTEPLPPMPVPALSKFVIRPARADETELHFVVKSWLRSFKKFSHAFKDVPNDRFFLHRDMVVKSILVRAQVRVAVLAESDVTVVGFIVWEPAGSETLLHYCYVKDSFRRAGVGRALAATVPQGKIVLTHRTDDSNVYLERHKWQLSTPGRAPSRLIYDPDMVVQWSPGNGE